MATPSIGFVPFSFPRDPVEVNQFDEHLILGQILQPLVETDTNGSIIPGISKSWKCSESGLEWTFDIDPTVKFSTGKHLNSDDVIYTLNRHLHSGSQSASFLSDVTSIKKINETRVKITLKEANSAILKVLSRDQLGIVPNGWRFEATSIEPIIGTGAYKLVQDKNKVWFLEQNKYSKIKGGVFKWEIVKFNDFKNSLPAKTPDLFGSITNTLLDRLNEENRISEHKIEQRFSYSQTSFWFHPKSRFASDKMRDDRGQVVKILNSLIKKYAESRNLKLATGPIPVGVPGHSDVRENYEEIPKNSKSYKIKLAYLSPIFDSFLLFAAKSKDEINLEIEAKAFTPSNLNEIKNFQPDIVTGSWAGGFYDPMGFLPLTKMILDENFETLLGEKVYTYKAAKAELDNLKRSKLFSEINSFLIKNFEMVPGWRQSNFLVFNSRLKMIEKDDRYTPRLINFK